MPNKKKLLEQNIPYWKPIFGPVLHYLHQTKIILKSKDPENETDIGKYVIKTKYGLRKCLQGKL